MAKQLKDTAIYTAFDDYVPFDPANPERNLLRAILTNALSDLRKPGELSRRAKEYFLAPEDDYIFSFSSVCNFLQVDAKRILIVAGLSGESTAGVKLDGRELSAHIGEQLQGAADSEIVDG